MDLHANSVPAALCMYFLSPRVACLVFPVGFRCGRSAELLALPLGAARAGCLCTGLALRYQCVRKSLLRYGRRLHVSARPLKYRITSFICQEWAMHQRGRFCQRPRAWGIPQPVQWQCPRLASASTDSRTSHRATTHEAKGKKAAKGKGQGAPSRPQVPRQSAEYSPLPGPRTASPRAAARRRRAR